MKSDDEILDGSDAAEVVPRASNVSNGKLS